MAQIADLTVKIGADTAELSRKLKSVSSKVSDTSKRMASMGASLSKGLTLPLAAAGGAAVKFASDYEQAMVEVQKVTDEATADKLSESIRRMAKTIPMAQTEIAGLTADAARFGIEGTENIESFTKTVAKMAEATDLTADQAGEAFAKIGQQANVSASEMGNLGSSINALSNNMATSANEIVQGMLRSSAAASQFGLSGQQIAGVSAQMNAMSESSERAGTRLRRLFQEIANPKKIKDIAGALGLSTDQFRQMQKENPQKVFQRLVQAMADGGQAADNLKRTLSSTSRQAIQALAQNTEGLNRALGISAEEFDKNTSLNEEFAAAVDTFSAKMQLLWNQIKDVGITIGNMLIPVLSKLIDNYVKPAVEWFQGLSDRAKQMSVVIGGVVAAIPPLIAAIGGIGTVLGAVMSPIGLAIGALAALAGAVTYIIKNWEALKTRFTSLAWWRNALVDMLQFLIDWNPFTKLIEGFNALLSYLGRSKIPNPFSDLSDSLEGLKDKTVKYSNSLQSFGEFMSDVGSDVQTILGNMTNKVFDFANSLDNTKESAKEAADQIKRIGLDSPGKIPAPEMQSVKEATGKSPTEIAMPSSELDRMQARMDAIKQKAKQINQAISVSISSAMSTIAEGIGKMATGAASAGDVLRGLLGVVLNLAKRVGKIAIGVGIAIQGIKEALKSLNPIAAIAAGAALIAVASAAQSALANAAEGGGGGSQGNGRGADVPRMATGGVVPEGFPSDNYPALLQSGEEVIPAPKKSELMKRLDGMKEQKTQVVEVPVYLDSREIYRGQQRYKDKVKR